MRNLTDRQMQVLDFIKEYIDTNTYSPAVRDVAKAFDITVKAAHDHLKALERKGVLRSSEGIPRSMGIVGYTNNKAETITIPVLGATAAGLPILAEENKEYDLELPSTMLKGKDNYFALHVEGDSMIELVSLMEI